MTTTTLYDQHVRACQGLWSSPNHQYRILYNAYGARVFNRAPAREIRFFAGTNGVLEAEQYVAQLITVTINVASLIDPDALAHVSSLFAPTIEDDSWLLAMPTRSSERWYDWIV